MAPSKFKFLSKIHPVFFVFIGVLIVVIAVKTRKGPKRLDLGEAAAVVRVVKIERLSLAPRANGYGVAQPRSIWKAVAEVDGRIEWMAQGLEDGEFVSEGDELLRIDRRSLEFTRTQTDANRERLQASLAELQMQDVNDQASLVIEKRSLTLLEKELKRQKNLYAQKTVSQKDVDDAERNLLTQRSKVQSLENTLRLSPSNQVEIEMQVRTEEAKLDDIDLDLSHTSIRAPFAGRISGLTVEPSQYARVGEVLFSLDEIAVSEITTQISVDKMLPFLKASDNATTRPLSMQERLESRAEAIHATVFVRTQEGETYRWPGRFVRVRETLDPKSRTVGVVIAVDDPYKALIDGTRPPLAKGMFVEVALRGMEMKDKIVVPRLALHDGMVYLVNSENRLERRSVQIDFHQGEYAVIRSGLQGGERLVVTDLSPAVSGMLLKASIDESQQQKMREKANGDID